MSTNSMIGMELEDGTVIAVYCHFDGYLRHNGYLLETFHKSAYRVKFMIEMGDISSLLVDNGTPQHYGNSREVSKFNSRDEYLRSSIDGELCEYTYLFIEGDSLKNDMGNWFVHAHEKGLIDDNCEIHRDDWAPVKAFEKIYMAD